MTHKEIEQWLKDNNYQNSGLRTDRNHRIDLYLSDVLLNFAQQQVKNLNIPAVSVRCCANCSHFNYDAPRFDQPYPEFWCGKEHWRGISNSEEYEGLNKPFECADFYAR